MDQDQKQTFRRVQTCFFMNRLIYKQNNNITMTLNSQLVVYVSNEIWTHTARDNFAKRKINYHL